MRLDCFLRERGIPRRESRELLAAGKITVNDAPAQALGQDCGPEDRIFVDGAAVGPVQLRYVMLNKPAGYVTAVSDPEPCVMDLLPEQFRTWGLFPVGRLDKASEGLLLLTNDGGFCQRILSPAEHLPKRYFIAVDRPFPPETERQFRDGICLSNGEQCRPAEIQVAPDRRSAWVVVTEGKNHQVRRMAFACGPRVGVLRRESIGALELDPLLPPGACRELTAEEVALLR